METNATIKDRTERSIIAHKQVAFKAKLMLSDIEALLKRFEGKKIFTVNGTFTEAFDGAYQTMRESFNLSNNQRFWMTKEYKDVYLCFDFWVSFGQYLMSDGSVSHDDGEYYKITPYLGRVKDGGVLVLQDEAFTKINESLDYYLTQDYETVKITQAKIREAEEALRALKNSLPNYIKY